MLFKRWKRENEKGNFRTVFQNSIYDFVSHSIALCCVEEMAWS